MTQQSLTDEEIQQAADVYNRLGLVEGAKHLGLNRSTFDSRVSRAERRGLVKRNNGPRQKIATTVSVHPALESAPVEDDDLSVEEIVAYRKKQFNQKRKKEEQASCIDVTVKLDGAIGILWFGDPHVDDDGTDIGLLEEHTDLVNRTDGLFAANVGDVTNNWVGRLARLYATQGTTAKQAWMLAEWLIKRCPWLVLIGGNHDLWSGAGDPLNWIARGQTQMHAASEARFALCMPGGRRVVVNSRHDFAGHSQWNAAHGTMKAAQMGPRDHINVAGHKHVSGYGVVKDPDTKRVCHALQIGSYKTYDRYARDRGFRDQMLGPCAMTLIDPRLPETHPDMVKVYWDPFEGADVLKFKRKRAA